MSSLRRPPVAGSVPATVIGLGTVSLITDISAEMVTAVLPLYLVYGVGVGLLQLGAVEAFYTAGTAALRLAGGYLADRLARPKTVAAVGYALSAIAKLGLPAAGGSVPAILAALAVDRAGKGIRTGPRDAIISAVAAPESLGRAFGVHRAMDTAGALLGPLVAAGLLALTAAYDPVFVVSFALGVIGVLVLVFFVSAPPAFSPTRQPSLRVAWNAIPKRLCVIAAVLGVVTIGDMVLYVVLQRRAGLPMGVLALLPLGTAVTFLVAAVPVGRVADRVGRWRVFLAGHVLLIAAYLTTGFVTGLPALAALALHGMYYACTDGVLMAIAGPLIPQALRATGLTAVQTVQALARATGAVAVGAGLTFISHQVAFTVLAVLLAIALVTLGSARSP